MYKDEIKKAMDSLGQRDDVVFIGYGLKYGSKGAGFLKDIDPSKIIETPVAENLMLSMAIGMSLMGYLPVVIYERMDFIMNAMDALVNHLDKIRDISGGEFKPKVIIRCIVGGKNIPFFTGITHTQDHTEGLKWMLRNIHVDNLVFSNDIQPAYDLAANKYSDQSAIFVEYKDLYNLE